MKKSKTILYRITALFMTVALSLSFALPVLASENETIYLNSAADLLEFSRKCSLDTWSQGKTVVLQKDVSLEGEVFEPIPIFSGTFEGNGHTISGLKLTEQVYPTGLFGIVQQSGVVKGLTVEGIVAPEGDADTLGGIVGINHGQLTDCIFQGTVDGKTTVGGVVGLNEPTGQLINCSFRGTVTGEHYVGGIAGQNLGSLVRCENQGSINTTQIEVEEEFSVPNDFNDLRNTEDIPVGTDIGGIAGYSCGILQSCTNGGNVGYDHMGYNVGGIAGRQTGYLDGCVNTGTVKGRKDVGGIAGQMEPQVTLKYNEDALNNLWEELDVLEELVDQATDHAEGISDSISGDMSALTDSVGVAKDSASDLADAMGDWANENIGQLNDASARLSWVIDQMEPILDDISLSLDEMQIAMDGLSDAMETLSSAGDPLGQGMAELSLAMEELKTAVNGAGGAVTSIREAVNDLKEGLGDFEEVSGALSNMAGGLATLGRSLANISASAREIADVLPETALWVAENPTRAQALAVVVSRLNTVASSVETVAVAAEAMGAATGQVAADYMAMSQATTEEEMAQLQATLAEDLVTLTGAANSLDTAVKSLNVAYTEFLTALKGYTDAGGETSDEVAAAVAELDAAITTINTANVAIQKAANEVSDPATAPAALFTLQTELTNMQNGLIAAADALETINELAPSMVPGGPVILAQTAVISENMAEAEKAANQIADAIEVLEKNIDSEKLAEAGTHFETALEQIKISTGDLSDAVGHMQAAASHMQDVIDISQQAMDLAAQACADMGEAMSLLGDGVDDMKDVFHELSEMPTIQFQSIGSDITDKGDALDDALGMVLERMDVLNGTMSSSSDILLADIKAINTQMGVVIDALRSCLEDTRDSMDQEHFEDVSDVALDDDAARVTASRNSGTVEGDINAAGIVGSLAIEYDFDPEDDITESGERSLDGQYQAAAVVRDCQNEGSVIAKKNYAGGIVGRMDLGSVARCVGCGQISSTDGDYVGGIAGLTRAVIRGCFAKCTLTGERYVGGIAGSVSEDGSVTGSYAMVEISSAQQYAGAICGDDVGIFQNNFFVSDSQAGLGRVSYTGRAEPMDYESLLAVDALPDVFRSFTLRFVAEDEELKSEVFQYGDSFGAEVYPDIPVREGEYGQWNRSSLNNLRFETVVEAIYTPYITTLSSEMLRENSRPVFYLDGQFREGDAVKVQEISAEQSVFEEAPSGRWRERIWVEEWQVSIPKDGQETHLLRYLPGSEDVEIWVDGPDGPHRVETKAVGQYLTFEVDGEQVQVTVFDRAFHSWIWIVLGMTAAALIIIVVWVVIRRKRKQTVVQQKQHDSVIVLD